MTLTIELFFSLTTPRQGTRPCCDLCWGWSVCCVGMRLTFESGNQVNKADSPPSGVGLVQSVEGLHRTERPALPRVREPRPHCLGGTWVSSCLWGPAETLALLGASLCQLWDRTCAIGSLRPNWSTADLGPSQPPSPRDPLPYNESLYAQNISLVLFV